MKYIDLTIDEEYDTTIPAPTFQKTKREYPVFKNPDKKEIREVKESSQYIRFIGYKDDLYIFSGELLHANAIKAMGLPISTSPNIREAFCGIARVGPSGLLQYHDSNQLRNDRDAALASELHSYITPYFE